MQLDEKRLEKKVQEFRESTSHHIKELKQVLESFRTHQTNSISFFSYSFDIPHQKQADNMCLASYHIQNTGDYTITNPEIGISISEDSPFVFHGKYFNTGSSVSSKLKGGWERLNGTTSEREFRLKPIDETVILPGETMSFPDFQINWQAIEDYSGSITGITFSDQFPEGIKALNAINISGTVPNENEEDCHEYD